MIQVSVSAATCAHIGRLVDEFRREHHVPGIAYGVVADGVLVLAGGSGGLSVAATERPDQHTRSRICSMSKSFVAAAVLKLRDAGFLALADAISIHVPELRSIVLPTTDSPAISVGDLLSMGAGLPEDDAWADRLLDASSADLDAVLRSGVTFSTAPRTTFEYSNFGWAMLGRMVSNITGVPVQRYVSEEILVPLGVDSTTWDAPFQPNVMTGYRWNDEWVEEPVPLANGAFAALGGLWSTVHDLARWVSFLADAFPPRDEHDAGPLCRASRREMQQVHRARPSTFETATNRLDAGGYGYGLVVTHDLRFGHVVNHSGGLPGFGSDMRWLPDRRFGVIALANLTYAPMRAMTRDILETLADHEELPPPDATPLSPALAAACDELARLLGNWGDHTPTGLFAANVLLDKAQEERRAEAARLQTTLGPWQCGPVVASTATSGSFTLQGELGAATVSVRLSPEVPPRIQTYGVNVAEHRDVYVPSAHSTVADADTD